jgi:hypothetical protein
MSLIDTITAPLTSPRRSSRASVSALAKPLPSGVAAAVERVEKARAALDAATSARSELAAVPPHVHDAEIKEAETRLHEATISREIADRLGDDGNAPTLADIEKLEKALAQARASVADVETKRAAYTRVVNDRKAALTDVHSELSKLLAPWLDNALSAADAKVAEGMRMIAEGRAAFNAVRTWQTTQFEPIRHPSLANGDRHTLDTMNVDRVELPADVKKALAAWREGFRVSLRN